MTNMSTIFSKIINKEIPSDMVYQDDMVTAFRDINPQAPTHILIVPNKEIATDAEAGVEVACVDLGGWDTHVAQGGAEGLMARNLSRLSDGLTAFYEDLGDKMGNVTVLVMSEFGRRIRENAGKGTDHGHGNMMMLMGGGVNGNQVHARWPGIHPDVQEGPGDLVITTDYRNVLGEALRKRAKNPAIDQIFAGFEVRETGLFLG